MSEPSTMWMDPVVLRKLDPVLYCRHMSQKAYAGQRLAKVIYDQSMGKAKSEYLVAIETGPEACRALKERDMQLSNYLNMQLSPAPVLWRYLQGIWFWMQSWRWNS